MQAKLNIKVVYATSAVQRVVSVRVPAGTVAREAVDMSGIGSMFADIDLLNAPLGVYGESVADNYLLQEGDRLEIYRPLENDPRDRRRELAASGKTMGRSETDSD